MLLVHKCSKADPKLTVQNMQLLLIIYFCNMSFVLAFVHELSATSQKARVSGGMGKTVPQTKVIYSSVKAALMLESSWSNMLH